MPHPTSTTSNFVPWQVRTNVWSLPTAHVPPFGYVWTCERLVMRGAELLASMIAGEKTLTTRCWCDSTVRRMQAVARAGHLVRVQKAYEFSSIIGWALLASVSAPALALSVLNQHTLKLAGCGHLSTPAYIREYISCDDPNPLVVLVVIRSFWQI